MCFSNSLLDIDRKSDDFCPRCKGILKLCRIGQDLKSSS